MPKLRRDPFDNTPSRIPILFTNSVASLTLILLFASITLAAPYGVQSNQTVAASSNEIWAQVVANVAPLMALVGERNAKEYLRTASSWHQFWTMSAAPIGILSIMVSAIRLSGPHFLRRLVGRDSERLSDALVELTPLSITPATSVFTPQAVEIEPQPFPDRVAFVCAHLRRTDKLKAALAAFQSLYRPRISQFDPDIDCELLLALWGSTLQLEKVAVLIESFADESESAIPDVDGRINHASLSFRTTGVSPTQTVRQLRTWATFGVVIRDVVAGLTLFTMMAGVQVVGFLQEPALSRNLQSLLFGICGYTGIVMFSSGIFAIIKDVVILQPERLSELFRDAIWTFSNAHHTEHKATVTPSSNGLVVARPTSLQPRERVNRHILTTFLCAGLVCSFVFYYLGLRASIWWVGLSNLVTLWISALYRATVVRKSLTSINQDIGEHWIGLTRSTVADSLLATLNDSADRDLYPASHLDNPLISTDSQTAPVSSQQGSNNGILTEKPTNNCVLVALYPHRNAFPSWSGVEDVMKVALEMTKIACFTRVCSFESMSLKNSKCRRLVRLRLAIYVSGLTWLSSSTIDLVVGTKFNLDFMCRETLRLIHMCMDQQGEVYSHTVDNETATRLSHVLCGPVAFLDDLPPSMLLRQLLTRLRDANPDSPHKYTLEQAMLLPTMQLATIYDRWFLPETDGVGHEIDALQTRFLDNLSLSGQTHLSTLQDVFERERLWDIFMRLREKPGEREAYTFRARGVGSGEYDPATVDHLSAGSPAAIYQKASAHHEARAGQPPVAGVSSNT